METLKQPKALSTCFFTEMWERFGFILLQTLLIFVFLDHFHFSPGSAANLVGIFGGMIFLTAISSGYIADFYLGYYRSVILGSILLTVGYTLVTLSEQTALFFLGLSVICLGTGLLKTNVSAFLGKFYQNNDPRRNTGFTIFYIGINLGAIIAGLLSTYLINKFNLERNQPLFLLGTTSSLFAGLVFFISHKIHKFPIFFREIDFKSALIATALCLITLAVTMLSLYYTQLAQPLFLLIAIICIISLIRSSIDSTQQLKNTIIYILFLIIGIIFWMLFYQIYISINIFNKTAINTHFYGITLTPQAFASLNSLFVIIIGLSVMKFWDRISDTLKFTLGAFSVCITFIILWLSVHLSPTDNTTLISPWWVVCAYITLTFSEICISPVGLALATKLAPPHRNGLFLSAWFVVIALGSDLAGVISKHANIPSTHTSLILIKQTYLHLYQNFTVITGCMLIITIILCHIINLILNKT